MSYIRAITLINDSDKPRRSACNTSMRVDNVMLVGEEGEQRQLIVEALIGGDVKPIQIVYTRPQDGGELRLNAPDGSEVDELTALRSLRFLEYATTPSGFELILSHLAFQLADYQMAIESGR